MLALRQEDLTADGGHVLSQVVHGLAQEAHLLLHSHTLPDNRAYLETVLQLASADRISPSADRWAGAQLYGKSSEA